MKNWPYSQSNDTEHSSAKLSWWPTRDNRLPADVVHLPTPNFRRGPGPRAKRARPDPWPGTVADDDECVPFSFSTCLRLLTTLRSHLCVLDRLKRACASLSPDSGHMYSRDLFERQMLKFERQSLASSRARRCSFQSFYAMAADLDLQSNTSLHPINFVTRAPIQTLHRRFRDHYIRLGATHLGHG